MSNLFEVDPWHLIANVDRHNLTSFSKALTISNPMMEIDGSFEETPSKVKLQNVWIPSPARTASGYRGSQPDFLDLTKIQVFLNNQSINWEEDKIIDETVDLDLHNGVLSRTFIVERADLKVRLNFVRFLSMAMPDLMVQRLECENLGVNPIEIEIHAGMDTSYNEETVDPKWEILNLNSDRTGGQIVMITRPQKFNSSRLMAGAANHSQSNLRSIANPDFSNYRVENRFLGTVMPKQKSFFEKRVVIATSKDFLTDRAISERLFLRSNEIDNFSFEDLLKINDEAWQSKLADTDIVITGNDLLQQRLRWANYVMLSNEKVTTPLSWSNEAFFVPALIEAGHIDEAKELLNQRYQELPALKDNARATGAQGAMLGSFSYEGHENQSQQEFGVHRSAALVFAIKSYLDFTKDMNWLDSTGKEMLNEIAIYWCSRVQYSEFKESYVVLSVTGPDEYEFNVNNNWLTNFSIKRGLAWILKTIPQEFDEDTTKKINEICDQIYLPEFDVDGKSIKLEDDAFLAKDLSLISEKLTIFDLPVNEKWSKDHIARSPIHQQPDALLGFYYAPELFSPSDVKANFNFYHKYIVHETDISMPLTSLIAAMAGELSTAFELECAGDTMLRDQAAVVRLAISRGLLGLSIKEGILSIAPQVPDEILSYQISLYYQESLLEITVKMGSCRILLKKGSKLNLIINGKEEMLSDGDLFELKLH